MQNGGLGGDPIHPRRGPWPRLLLGEGHPSHNCGQPRIKVRLAVLPYAELPQSRSKFFASMMAVTRQHPVAIWAE